MVEDIASDHILEIERCLEEALDVGKELEPLLVGDLRERIVWAGISQERIEAGEVIGCTETINVVPKGNITELCFDSCEFCSMNSLTDLSFFKDGETLVHPHV